MLCPFCKESNLAVVDSRDAEGGEATRRRRECEECGRRFTTYERAEGIDLKVLKKDGTKELFNRDKIKKGLIKATWKRPVSVAEIEALVSEVESKLRDKGLSELKSWEIGNLVINRLKKLDALGYLLFATVYRDFESLEDFKEEITKLEK
ncbi:MAG: transcriptional repressor NrdR [Candidatus Pacebacteria bacterium]|jgi:transcriptional repressor NrdR|nr:transcriptional repressor NrdR [Candidatus Paceibacterota bacterium]MBT4652518.1 transcriptional repressor NrdR [Candidatus Paceibacterota bacterium]MBT6756345.1 transcriptional repressor NrdR [Candidatus Paceibacterota bacterium]MBT6921636.1 transcriptional repressor NrdR [Candidatus Paceibacterota bacterium]